MGITAKGLCFPVSREPFQEAPTSIKLSHFLAPSAQNVGRKNHYSPIWRTIGMQLGEVPYRRHGISDGLFSTDIRPRRGQP